MEIRKIRVSDGGKLRKPTTDELSTLVSRLTKAILKRGYSAYISIENGTAISIAGGISLTDEFVKKFGLNRSTYRRTRSLNWDQFVIVNETINDVLTYSNMSANVSSLHGKFKIREGFMQFYEEDWESLKWENVGSRMNPVLRGEHNANDEGYDLEDFREFFAENSEATKTYSNGRTVYV